MKRRLATRGGILLPALLALAVYAGCGGDAEVTLVRPNTSPDVAGVVELPSGVTEASATGFFSRLASLIVARAEALIGVAPAANAPVEVTRYTQDDILNNEAIGTVEIGSTTTGSDGRYQVPLGNDIIDDCGGGRILVSTSLGGTTRAFAFSDQEDTIVNAASEAMVRLIVDEVKAGQDYCTPTNDDLRQLLASIDEATAEVSGATVNQINANATQAAAESPGVQQMLRKAFGIATPTPLRTNTPTATSTPTTVVVNTATPTQTSTNTTAATPTNTLTATATAATATNTPTATDTPPTVVVDTPTNTPTNTEVPTNTPTNTEVPTDTPTATAPPTDTPTVTISPTEAEPTSTATMPPTKINLDNGSGAPEATVVITGTLVGGMDQVVGTGNDIFFPLADLNITASNCKLDPRLVGGSIDKQIAVAVTSGTPSGAPPGTRRLRIGIFGTNQNVIPDGALFECTFSILAAATPGDKLLTNVPSASGVSTSIPVGGSNGIITVTSGGNPTATATVAPPTATSVPPTATATVAPPTSTQIVGPTDTATPLPPTATATSAPPTATSAPPTATSVPPTATSVPATATSVPATATSAPATPTTAPSGAAINLNSGSGAPGGMVTITGTLANSANDIVGTGNDIFFPLADLTITTSACTLDARLKGGDIDKQIAVAVTSGTPSGAPPGTRRLRIGIFGTNQNVIPDGPLFSCTFSILAAATPGDKTLTNVATASGVSASIPVASGNGTITVTGGGGGSTPTQTVAVPTATQIPPTATAVPPTATAVPPTATAVPPTATAVPATPTGVPATPTTGPSGPAINLSSGSGSASGMVTITGTLVNSANDIVGTGNDIFFPLADLTITTSACTLDARLKGGDIDKQIAVAVTSGTPSGAPPGTRRLRIGIFGTNQNVIPDGPLFSCNFSILAAATPGAKTLANVASASGVSASIPVASGNGSITVN